MSLLPNSLMGRLHVGLTMLLSALVILAAAPNLAAEQSQAAVKEASTRFKRGVELFDEGDFRTALIEFRRAYAVAPDFNVLYNIGQTQYQLSDYAGAFGTLTRYLEDGGEKIKADRRGEVESALKKLEARVGKLRVSSNVEGAEILVDDVKVGVTPLAEPLLVSAGRRKVSAASGTRPVVVRKIDVAGGDDVELSLDFPVLEKKPSGQITLPTPSPPVERYNRMPMWISLVAAAGFTAGAGVSGVLALRAKDELAEQLDTFPTTAEQLDDARSKTQTLAIVADVLGVAGVLAAGVTVYFIVDPPVESGDEEPAKPAAARLLVAPTGLWLQGQF